MSNGYYSGWLRVDAEEKTEITSLFLECFRNLEAWYWFQHFLY